MPLTINIPDTLRKSVEAASQGKNTVLYTAAGQPCYMTVIPAFDVSTIDASLGSGTHPAFIVNGVTKPYLYLGQYIGVSRNSEMLSLPGQDPINTINHDSAVSLVRANGTGWHLMSNAEWAAMQLWCWKNGYQPRGNSNWGRSSDVTTEYGVRGDGLAVGTASGTGRTQTGSGPMSWRHDNTPFGISDLCGNVWEWSPGMRVNNGEINIIQNNDAAISTTDFGVSSSAWYAIDGSTGSLVAPGSANTVKYATSGTANYTLVCGSGAQFSSMTNPGATPVGATALQLCKKLGLYPIASSALGSDIFYITTTGEMLPFRGGVWYDGASAGVFELNLNYARSYASSLIGARPAFVS